MEIIGQGEVAALEIIKDMFGNSCEYLTQVKLSDMVSPDYLETLSDRQLKETIDIVVDTGFQYLAIRVQDKHHASSRMATIDNIQKLMLEWNGWKVIDIWHYECKELWKDKVNKKSRLELELAIKESSID
jgi:hypothetical protein|tara:strand:+ start:575 stop:964 length:390 start_codon:yes stop_codon:yes gene_type:complete